MREIYVIVANLDNARIFALILSCMVSLGFAVWVWSTAKHANIPLTSFGWAQVYVFGMIAFMSACLVLGYLIVPKNAEKLVDLMGVERLLDAYSRQVQAALIFIVRLAM